MDVLEFRDGRVRTRILFSDDSLGVDGRSTRTIGGCGRGKIDLIMRRVNTLRRGVWPRAVALAVIFSLFFGPVHISAIADGLRDGSNVSDSCESCQPTSAEAICESDLQCNHDACAHATDSRQHETPDSDPCCPNNCEHCSLPCCGGTFLALCLPPATVMGAPIPTSVTLPADDIPSAVELAGIFHPPRA